MPTPPKPFKVVAAVRRMGQPEVQPDEWYNTRVEAAAAFRRYACNPHLSYVEVWDCAEDANTAIKLWVFEP